MGPNSSPCLTLLTALVSITSALGLFNNPQDADKYQHDILATLVHVMAKSESRSLQDVLREAFMTRPYQLEGYDGYNIDLDDPPLNDKNDHYNKFLSLVSIKDLYPDYEEGKEDFDNLVETAKRANNKLSHEEKMRKLYQQTEINGEPIKLKITSARSQTRPPQKPRQRQKPNCPIGQDGLTLLTCPNTDTCLKDTMICDGHNDCPNHEDENFTLCVVRRWFKALEKKITLPAQIPSV